jgi:hypothetical protein
LWPRITDTFPPSLFSPLISRPSERPQRRCDPPKPGHLLFEQVIAHCGHSANLDADAIILATRPGRTTLAAADLDSVGANHGL